MAKFNFKVGDKLKGGYTIAFIKELIGLVILQTPAGYTGCFLMEDGKGGWEVDKCKMPKAVYHKTLEACKQSFGV